MQPSKTVRGDTSGLMIPADIGALLAAGPEFLTLAFRAFGSISQSNRVTGIVEVEPCAGGSTGHKFYLTLTYADDELGLDCRLFLKFSRDFGDERRDRQRTEMASEARFTALSRLPGMPIRVPLGYFADYHAASGTGIVITECVDFGVGGIEAHRAKTLDHETMDTPIDYYRTSVTALARLAGAHKGGKLVDDIAARFPWDPVAGSADPILYGEADLQKELDRCFAFALDCPQLLPEEVRRPEFFAQMKADATLIKRHEEQLQAYLCGNPEMIALCHWNAHIDNIWFWRDEAQALHCGLLDWGRVGQISFGSALWGGLSAAHHDIWDIHLDDLLALFVREYHASGGPLLDGDDLALHLSIHMAVMGVARVLAFPEIIAFRLPDCAKASGPRDPMFLTSAPARNCLSVYTVFLQHWRRQDFGSLVTRVLA